VTLTELRYIVAVAEQRHFGRAAKACLVSQPTLSVAVKRLEDELGVILFERSRNEITITPAGEQIVDQAQRVLAEAAVIGEIAHANQDQLSSPLRIGAVHSIGPYLLPQLIPAMNRLAPEVPLLVEENYTHVLGEKLRRGDLDLIIVSLPFSAPGILTRPLYDEPFVVLLPAAHALAGKDAVTVEELEKEKVLLLGEGHCLREQVLAICPNCQPPTMSDLSLRKALEGASLETIRMMVASGAGITVMPGSAAAEGHAAQNKLLATRPFKGSNPERRVAMAWRSSFPRPKAIDAVQQALSDVSLGGVKMHPPA